MSFNNIEFSLGGIVTKNAPARELRDHLLDRICMYRGGRSGELDIRNGVLGTDSVGSTTDDGAAMEMGDCIASANAPALIEERTSK